MSELLKPTAAMFARLQPTTFLGARDDLPRCLAGHCKAEVAECTTPPPPAVHC